MSRSLGDSALIYAEKYKFQVFPLKERSKLPATLKGFYDASCITSVIQSWWDDNSLYNIGLRTGASSGVWVLDIDGEAGKEDLASLEALHGSLPKTPTQLTANGQHLIFSYPEGMIIGNRTKLIRHDKAGGIDVRGNGGYIVLSPSIHPDTGKTYSWLIKPSDQPFAAAPQWLLDMVVKQSGDFLVQPSKIFNPPTSKIINRTRPEDILHDQIRAIETAPQGSRNHILNVAAMKVGKILETGIIEETTAKNLLANAALKAGLDQSEIPATINSGLNYGKTQPYKYSQNGSYNTPHNVTTVYSQHNLNNDHSAKNDFDAETGEIKEDQKPNKFNVFSYEQLIHFPRTEWIIKNIFPKKSFGIIYGKPGQGKTFIALDMALCIAHGMQWHDMDVSQGSVLYIAGEGFGGLGKRLKAWTYHNARNELTPPFYAITANVNMRSEEDVNAVIAAIDGLNQKFSLIVIDTVARSILGGDENSATDMGLFIAACDSVKDYTGAAVIGVHHSGKDDEKGMRGSSALLGAVDTVIQIIQDDNKSIVLTMEKQKDAEPIKDIKFDMIVIPTSVIDTSVVVQLSSDQTAIFTPKNKKVDLYIEALWDCISNDKLTLNGLPASTEDTWKDLCFKRSLGGDNDASKRTAFWRAKKRLQETRKIYVENSLVSCLEEKN